MYKTNVKQSYKYLVLVELLLCITSMDKIQIDTNALPESLIVSKKITSTLPVANLQIEFDNII